MKKSRKKLGVIAGLVVLGLVSIAPAEAAWADVLKNGHQSCLSPTPFSWVKFVTKGTRYIEPPGLGTTAYSGSATTWYTGAKQGANGGGNWFVQATVDMQTLNTYAYCTAGG